MNVRHPLCFHRLLPLALSCGLVLISLTRVGLPDSLL